MDIQKLKTATRETTGNGPARVLRRDGKIPAVFYGNKVEPVKLAVDSVDLENALKGSNINQILLNIIIDGDEKATRTAMIKELQVHPISRDFIHIDLYEIQMDQKIKVKVPVVVNGKSVGVEMGGVMQLVRRELEVLCLPHEIPESFEIDISGLEIGDSIHVAEIPLSGNVEIPFDANYTIVTVLSPKVEEEEEEELEEGEELDEEAAEGEEEPAPEE